jgi:hypothetical protein
MAETARAGISKLVLIQTLEPNTPGDAAFEAFRVFFFAQGFNSNSASS